ncbi:MAG: family 20 glycosylhydrolase [Gemmatimonadaceae bacterium]
MRRLPCFVALAAAAVLTPSMLRGQSPIPVIPLPASVTPGSGAWNVPRALSGELAFATDAALAASGVRVRLVPADSTTGRESYMLTVAPDGVSLTAPTAAGRFYGLQTLQQLVDAARAAKSAAPTVDAMIIADAPRFPYRGLHLDVGRHFESVAFVKRYIDLMSRFKLNTFHWHLTEDQGWRIEIKKYPRLTTVGACRAETIVEKNFNPYKGDGLRHCGHYSQADIKEVVAYAAARHVTVIPEIEMPGHSLAAITAYPELACTEGPFAVMTIWGVSDDVLCPSEKTFMFLEDVLTEVLALFPSKMIHIGGDEAPKVRWKASPLAQEIIKREGLKDEHELQSWFIKRIDTWLTARGRRLVGWDEILEGGLAPGATVMSWRGISGGIDAARLGRDVIMTPGSHLYLDHYQGDARFEPLAIGGLTTLDRVYSFEPIPDALTADEAKHILGAQGNVWTEYLRTPTAVEYMAYPRALALAEVVWSPRESRLWSSFEQRLPHALRTLDRLKVNYRLPHVLGLDSDVLTLDSNVPVTLSVPIAAAEIRYTLDGGDPTRNSARYTGPIAVEATTAGVKVTARAFTADGKTSPPRAATFRRTTYREADRVTNTGPGLLKRYYAASVRSAKGVDSLSALRTTFATGIARGEEDTAEQYALRFDGYLTVPSDGLYEFSLSSDDGSTLEIGGTLVVDNDGFHSTEERTGMIALRAGAHPMVVRFFQGGGGAELTLRVRRPGEAWQAVPASWLSRRLW